MSLNFRPEGEPDRILIPTFHQAGEYGGCYDCPFTRPRDYPIVMLTIRHGNYGGISLRYCKEHYTQFKAEARELP